MLEDSNENPTRKAIIMALKLTGECSVEDLSREVKITPMGVRQHLLVLERNGLVEHITKKQGVGRPGFLYRLTKEADSLFPKQYTEFSLSLLKNLEEHEGREMVDALFRRRKEHIVAGKIKMFRKAPTVTDRLSLLAAMLRDEGGIVELEENGQYVKMKQFNCPLPEIAASYNEACTYDLALFQELLGIDISIEKRIIDGNVACVYMIPKADG